jgi:hypothetical protein
MHHHSDDVPDGYVPILVTYDQESGVFSVIVCMDGLHVVVEMPTSSPHTVRHLVNLSPVLGKVFVSLLAESMEINSDIKEKVVDAMENLDAAEAFLAKLDVIAPDQIVQQAKIEGGD